MGKKKFSKKAKGENGKGTRAHKKIENYITFKRENENYFNFYKAQALIPEEDFDAFIEYARRDLPTAFRVQGCHKDREQVLEELRSRFIDVIHENDEAGIYSPKAIPWYHGAFQSRMSRTEFRSHPALASLHNFLVAEAELGNVSRQEAVSMIPPLLLSPDSDHFVLDLCAAPGSKTMQLIEMMHETTSNPKGMVIANDLDKKRCYMLIHQALKRFNNASTVVINEDAARLPKMIWNDNQELKFDRVLADVICSGDGTVRKNLDIWDSWSPQQANSLHKLQLSIARQGATVLKVGGRMVYSTCSMNPVEDEAVIAQLLRESNGNLRLLDAHPLLPQLKALRGVSSWKIFTSQMDILPSLKDVPEKFKQCFLQSMFPPNEKESKEMHLEYAMRIMPHLQDTGGFFVALIEKVGECDFEGISQAKGAIWRKKLFRDDPFAFLAEDQEQWIEIKNHFAISDAFKPKNLFSRILEKQSRQLFYANDAVCTFMMNNMSTVSIQNGGMRMFVCSASKQTVQYRVSQEGVRVLIPFMGKKALKVTREDLMTILSHEHSLVPMDLLAAAAEIRANSPGCVVLYVDTDEPVCCWVGQKTCAPYVCKEEKFHLLRMLGGDTKAMEEMMRNKRRQKAEDKITTEVTASEENEEILEKCEKSNGGNELSEPTSQKRRKLENELSGEDIQNPAIDVTKDAIDLSAETARN